MIRVLGRDSGLIGGGNVGVNDVGGRLALGAGATSEMPTDGSALVGDDAQLGDDLDVYDLFANTLNVSFDPSGRVRHAGPICFTAPIVNSLPPFPAFSTGSSPADDLNVSGVTLPPGQYGKAILDDVTLEDGEYSFIDLKLNGDTQVSAGTVVRKRDPGTWVT